MLSDGVALKATNFKCFGEEPQGFEKIKPINIIIGKNNSGKTTLLDLLEHAIKPDDEHSVIRSHRFYRKAPAVLVTMKLSRVEIERYVSSLMQNATSNGKTFSFNPRSFLLQHFVNDSSTWNIERPESALLHASALDFSDPQVEAAAKYSGQLFAESLKRAPNVFQEYLLHRINAERDIVPEQANLGDTDFHPNGSGLTRAIKFFLHDEAMPIDLIERTLLDAVNVVMRPDSSYTRLLARHRSKNTEMWELLLQDSNGLIPLSQMGSGLKTVLLVLATLHLSPMVRYKGTSLSQHIFAFEELENFLHPAIQRRLLLYIRDFAIKNDCHFFITTHSNVVIDLFSRDNLAQIVHVAHDGEGTTVKTVESNEGLRQILDDLDVRASDLLQTNVVVWVEGPSDRIYFCKWVELWTDGELSEGVHFQCLPFGGSCNAHLSFEEVASEASESLIAALKINRHAILLADSDRQEDNDPLKEHTERLKDEVEKAGGLAWITAGREVESYIPQQVLEDLYGLAEAPERYANIVAKIRATDGHKSIRKTEIANGVCELLTKDLLRDTEDMAAMLDTVCNQIRQWNRKENQAS